MSFFKKIASFFAGLFKNPNMLQTAQSTLQLLGPLLTAVATAADPGDAPFIRQVVYEAITDLGTVLGILHKVQVSGAASPSAYSTAIGMLQGVNDNVGTLLSEAHVKNPGLLTAVTSVADEIKLVIGTLQQNPAPVNNNVTTTAASSTTVTASSATSSGSGS